MPVNRSKHRKGGTVHMLPCVQKVALCQPDIKKVTVQTHDVCVLCGPRIGHARLTRGQNTISKKNRMCNSIPWCLDLFGGAWESCHHTLRKNDGFGDLWHTGMHDWAVTVSLDKFLQSLV